MNTRAILISLPLLCLLSCYKREIQFGNNLADSHTNIIVIDTITPVMSTYVLDSFPTSGNSIMMMGRYKDPIMGTVSAATYFQVTIPQVATANFPDFAIYDSLVLIMKSNGYFYGDTTKPVNFIAYELAYQPDYTYATYLYNTSSIPYKPTPLGSITRLISPGRSDSLVIRLPDSKGLDLFNKLKTNAVEIQNENNFLQYFNGITVQPAAHDTGALYTFPADNNVRMALYYHVSNPFPVQNSFVFNVTRTAYQFNQVLADRNGTFLESISPGKREIIASETYPFGATQSGTGTLLKIKFPSLRELLKVNDLIRLLDAKLILKPVENTFDPYIYKLSPKLFLAQTDVNNNIGYSIADSTNQGILYSPPAVDDIYHANTNYTFHITSYINSLIQTPNSSETGVLVMEEDPTKAHRFNRTIIGSNGNRLYKTQLVLTMLTVN
jgi:hypothetical protein